MNGGEGSCYFQDPQAVGVPGEYWDGEVQFLGQEPGDLGDLGALGAERC